MEAVLIRPIVSVLFKELLNTLKSSEMREFARQLGGVDWELGKFERKLRTVEEVLSFAEYKQLKENNEVVKRWLDDLRDCAYDAEDLLDKFTYQGKLRMMKAEHQCMITRKASKLYDNYRMVIKIKEISSRLEQLCGPTSFELNLLKGMNSAGISSATPQEQLSSTVATKRGSSSLLSGQVFGREGDKAKILQMMSSDEPSDANFRVIAIVGMGGLGKTTLAQAVYNDEKVLEDFRFEKKAWVCVSDDFDVLRISKLILESITGSSSTPNNLNDVQVRLNDEVNGKKFLLVLDDVWDDMDYNSWAALKSPFITGARGSRLIVTTRLAKVASTIRSSNSYDLNRLSEGDCWHLFLEHAFGTRTNVAHDIPDSIRGAIVGRCGGLPLAAKTFGGLLGSYHVDAWKSILDNGEWDSTVASTIHPVLKLSYYYLPTHLKRCFAYCAVFPKDYEFEEVELSLLWMAEGIVQQSKNSKQRDMACTYFHDLSSRSLFQQSGINNSKYIMHDLVHDVAESMFGEIGFRSEKSNKLPKISERTRHFSYISGRYDGNNKFKSLGNLKSLRTFLPLSLIGFDYFNGNYITTMVPFGLLPMLKKLRVLSFRGYYIFQLPDSIGDLIHLRYIDFSYTMIKYLPESTCLLFNLETLILRHCHRLMKLPSNMRDLTNLCHLDIEGTNLLKEMPLGIEKLRNLQVLSNFIVSKNTGTQLKDLKKLSFLEGEFHILNLDNITDLKQIGGFVLSEMEHLKVLSLKWEFQHDHPQKEDLEKKILEMLRPHENLKSLTIDNYSGLEFPNWLEDSSSFSKMVVLKLINCGHCTILPSLGVLPSLKTLIIEGMKRLGKVGFQMPLKSLEILHFTNLQEWVYWDTTSQNDDVAFPCLHELRIEKCPRLGGKLPDSLPSLQTLAIRNCPELLVPLSSFPTAIKLEIDGCKVVDNSIVSINFESLHSVATSNTPEAGYWMKQGMYNVTSLKELFIGHCASLITFSALKFLPSLSYLEIKWCKALQFLPDGMKHYNKCLKRLNIEHCDSLTFIARGTLPSSLKHIKVSNCRQLQCLVDDRDDSCASSSSSSSLMLKESFSTCLLEELYIGSCPSITCISSGGEVPMTLEHLRINSCSKFTTLSRSHLPDALVSLRISRCPKIESIAVTFDNSTCLTSISLFNCEKLKSIPFRSLTCLKEIDILSCFDEIESLSLDHLHSLQHLSLSQMKIKRPLKLPHSLTMLSLWSPNSFTLEGLPSNLTDLVICKDVKFHKPLIELGLENLTSLRNLTIEGCRGAELIFQEDNKIPTSLTSLSFKGFPNLNRISSSLQSLTSLQYLKIRDCPKLKSIPDLGSLISLKTLDISDCPKLKSIPGLGSLTSLEQFSVGECTKLKSFQGLPSSLLKLEITDCPILKKQCRRDKGKYWSMIAQIPKVMIDVEFIHD